MRSITSGLRTKIGEDITNPIWLIYMDLGSSIWTTSKGYGWYDLIEYFDYGCMVHKVENDACVISLDNSDDALSVLCLGNDIQGNLVSAKIYYEGYHYLRFVGQLDSWEIDEGSGRIDFVATSEASQNQKLPIDFIGPTKFNHLPPPGTQIMAGDTPIILEGQPK